VDAHCPSRQLLGDDARWLLYSAVLTAYQLRVPLIRYL
jgi:hypothetical protein